MAVRSRSWIAGPALVLCAAAAPVHAADMPPPPAPEPADVLPVPAPAAVPLPGDEWTDPDRVNWSAAAPGDVRSGAPERRIGEGRILERLRGDRRPARDASGPAASVRVADRDAVPKDQGWPEPVRLLAQLDALASLARGHQPVAAWAAETRADVRGVVATAGPADAAAEATLLRLSDAVETGFALADGAGDATVATETRRAALAVARRVAVWRAAAAVCTARAAAPADVAAALAPMLPTDGVARLLGALERYEATPAAAPAEAARGAVDTLDSDCSACRALSRAVADHYLAPNVRVAVHRQLVARMLPEATVDSGRFQEFVLGRAVRGTRTVRQSTAVEFIPDPDEIRLEMLVHGEVDSRSVTDAGPVSIHSLGAAKFVVRKPIALSAEGVEFRAAVGSASNASRLATIETDFDSVPVMGSLVRSIARSQHDDRKAEATREVNDKIITRACREVDAQAQPKLQAAVDRVRERVWEPLVKLGLEPRAVALETTPDVATARLRLAGTGQVAAHTPRPRAPADAMLSMQVHESSFNNAIERLGLAGRTMELEDLVRHVCGQFGAPARIPDDLPEHVRVSFATSHPLRVECRDGLVHMHVTLDAIESGRRSWYDIVAHVAYRPAGSGAQVVLEREGPVQLSGPGQQGRMEIALRTIFGKIFAKERPIALLPEKFVTHPGCADLVAVQAVATDGWLALALAATTQAGGAATSPTAGRAPDPPRRLLRR